MSRKCCFWCSDYEMRNSPGMNWHPLVLQNTEVDKRLPESWILMYRKLISVRDNSKVNMMAGLNLLAKSIYARTSDLGKDAMPRQSLTYLPKYWGKVPWNAFFIRCSR